MARIGETYHETYRVRACSPSSARFENKRVPTVIGTLASPEAPPRTRYEPVSSPRSRRNDKNVRTRGEAGRTMEEDIGSQTGRKKQRRRERKRSDTRPDRFVSWNGVEPFCRAPLRNQAAFPLFPASFLSFILRARFLLISPGDMRNSDDVVSRIVGGRVALEEESEWSFTWQILRILRAIFSRNHLLEEQLK